MTLTLLLPLCAAIHYAESVAAATVVNNRLEEHFNSGSAQITPTSALTRTMPPSFWNPAFIQAQTETWMARDRAAGTGKTQNGTVTPTTTLITTTRALTRTISTSSDSYTINVSGTTAPINSFLRIENVGTTTVVRPKIVVNGKDWSTIDSILASILTPDMSADDKAHAIWQFARAARFHFWPPTQQTSDDTDPVKLFSAYGYGFCTDVALAMAAMFDRIGMPSRYWQVGNPPHHDVSEAWYDGAWHLLDADRGGLYLEADNRTIAGVEDLINDPGLVARAGPRHADLVSIYANTNRDSNWPGSAQYEVGHEISLTLRPREALVLNWQGIGLVHNDTGWVYPTPAEHANGQIISPVSLSDPNYRQWIVQQTNARSQADDGQSPAFSPITTSVPAELVYQVDSPYPIVGVTLTADLYRQSVTDTLQVYVSRYINSIELLGPELANNQYQLPGVYSTSVNMVAFALDGNWPPIHTSLGTEPANLIYRVSPLNTAGTRVQIGGRFYRYQNADVAAMSISTDGVNWQSVWQADQLGYFDHLEDITTRVTGLDSFYVRYDLEAKSINSIYGGWTAGLAEIRMLGVKPPPGALAWSATGNDPTGNFSQTIDLTPFIASAQFSANYHYQVRFVMQSPASPLSVGLNSFTLTTTVQVAPRSLPALTLGVNQVEYADLSSGPVNVQVTHGWVELDGWYNPLPPTAPIFPPNGAMISLTQPVTFTWQPASDPDGDEVLQYYVEICARPDCRWPLSSNFDVDTAQSLPGPDRINGTIDDLIIQNTNNYWVMPYYSWFNSSQTYYWRVKVEDVTGLWSEYSPIWSFTVSEVPLSGLNIASNAPTALGQPATLTATVSAGSNVTYTWDFGDGQLGSGKVVTHTYPAVGQYTAWLTATNALGVMTTTQIVRVEQPITGLVVSGGGLNARGTPAVFTATISAGSNVTYTWNFGDGQLGTGAVVSHTYAAIGLYKVWFTATNPVSTLTTTKSIDVEDGIAGLAIVRDSSLRVGLMTTLTATIAAGSNVTYTWNFGDGQWGTGQIVTHTYAAVGPYTLWLTATNPLSVVTATQTVQVQDVNIAGLAINGNSLLEVSVATPFTATVSAGSNVTYTWNFGDGQIGSGQAVMHTYANVGQYTMRLTATNSMGVFSVTKVVDVEQPISGLFVSGGGLNARGTTSTFIASMSAGSNVSFAWNFGDGQLGSGQTITHTYAAAGNYTAIVTATNPLSSVSQNVSITVQNLQPSLSSLSLSAMAFDNASLTLDVRGANFYEDSQVVVNGTPRAARYVNSTWLQVTISNSEVSPSTPATITVVNAAPGGGVSNAMTYKPAYLIWLPLVTNSR